MRWFVLEFYDLRPVCRHSQVTHAHAHAHAHAPAHTHTDTHTHTHTHNTLSARTRPSMHTTAQPHTHPRMLTQTHTHTMYPLHHFIHKAVHSILDSCCRK